MKNDADHVVELPFCCMLGFMRAVPASVRVSFLPSPRQTIEFPDDELVEPLEGLDIAEDGIELPPPPAPEADAELAPAKPNLLVSGRLMRRGSSIFREPEEDSQNKIEGSYVAHHCRSQCASCWISIQHRRNKNEECLVAQPAVPGVCVSTSETGGLLWWLSPAAPSPQRRGETDSRLRCKARSFLRAMKWFANVVAELGPQISVPLV